MLDRGDSLSEGGGCFEALTLYRYVFFREKLVKSRGRGERERANLRDASNTADQ